MPNATSSCTKPLNHRRDRWAAEWTGRRCCPGPHSLTRYPSPHTILMSAGHAKAMLEIGIEGPEILDEQAGMLRWVWS